MEANAELVIANLTNQIASLSRDRAIFAAQMTETMDANGDLRQKNKQLENDLKAKEEMVKNLMGQVAALENQVEELTVKSVAVVTE